MRFAICVETLGRQFAISNMQGLVEGVDADRRS